MARCRGAFLRSVFVFAWGSQSGKNSSFSHNVVLAQFSWKIILIRERSIILRSNVHHYVQLYMCQIAYAGNYRLDGWDNFAKEKKELMYCPHAHVTSSPLPPSKIFFWMNQHATGDTHHFSIAEILGKGWSQLLINFWNV